MVVRTSHLFIALLIAATQLSPIDPIVPIMAAVERIPGDLVGDMSCVQSAHLTRLDLGAAILCFFAFASFAERIVDLALPEAELGLASSSVLGLAGFSFALVGCCQMFGWHPCSEIVGVVGICGAAALLFVFAGGFAKCWLTGAWGRRMPRGPRDDLYEVTSPVRRRGPA